VCSEGELYIPRDLYERDLSLESLANQFEHEYLFTESYSIPAMSNPNQLFLLADHIKLSLLERQRAISLNLEPNSQDGHISRSLESFRAGLENIAVERERLEDFGDAAYAFSNGRNHRRAYI
jgi:hypothetical protein